MAGEYAIYSLGAWLLNLWVFIDYICIRNLCTWWKEVGNGVLSINLFDGFNFSLDLGKDAYIL